MKGAKGGKRDRLITLLFAKKKRKEKKVKEQLVNKKSPNDDGIKVINKLDNKPKEILNIKPVVFNNKVETKNINNKIVINKKPIVSNLNKIKVVKEQSPIKKEALNKNKNSVGIILPSLNDIKKEETTKKDKTVSKVNNDINFTSDNKSSSDSKAVSKNSGLEYIIYKKISKLLDKDYIKVNELEYKCRVISKEYECINDEKKLDTLKKTLEKLRLELAKIEDKYADVRDIDSLNKVINLDNTYIEMLLADYKKQIENNGDLTVLASRVKTVKYNSIMGTIFKIERDSKIIETRINDKIKDIDITNNKYTELEDEYLDTLNIQKTIKEFNSDINKQLKDIKEKMASAKMVNKRIDIYNTYSTDYNKYFKSLLMFWASKRIPNTLVGNTLKVVLISDAIMQISSATTKKRHEEEIVEIKYKDYAKEIYDSMGCIDNSIEQLKKAQFIVKGLKNTLANNLINDEYKELFNKVSNMEDDLDRSYSCLQIYKSDVEDKLYNNNAKVMTYGSLK